MSLSSSFAATRPYTASLTDAVSTKTSASPTFRLQCRVSTTNFSLRITNTCPPPPGSRRERANFVVKSVLPDGIRVLEEVDPPRVDIGGSDRRFPPDDGGNGGGDSGGDGGGKGEGGGEDGGDEEGMEFGPIMKFEEVMRESERFGASLPDDIIEAAKTTGIREVLLMRYFELEGSVWPLGFLMRHFGWLRNRMLADPAFLFKVGTEIVIDSCCATFAEVQKRGKDFWAEFELYLADLLVGIVVNVALVGMLAPYARFGQRPVSAGFWEASVVHVVIFPAGAFEAMGNFVVVDLVVVKSPFARRNYFSNLTGSVYISGVFEAERPGCRFSVQQRIASFLYTGVMQGGVGFGCGIIGQGIANLIMTAKRSIRKSDEDIPVPPLLKSAALWGFFLAVSSNTRYQTINGLERLVEASPLAKKIPPIALAFTVGVRFANNVYGGMQFVDWARLSGCQ